MQILNEYILNGMSVIEYTNDGETVSHIVKTLIVTEPIIEISQPTNQEINDMQIVIMNGLTDIYMATLGL